MPAAIPTPLSAGAAQPFAGVFTPATATPTLDTWQETKYIVYAQTGPNGASPYYDTAATRPFFTFSEFGYTDVSGTVAGDLSSTCPITYSLNDATNYDLDTSSSPNQVVLKDSVKETPGAYQVNVIGSAQGNPNTFEISFELILKDLCDEMAATGNSRL